MKFLLTIISLLTFVLSPQPVFAHIPGQPPFFRINEELADYYEIQSEVLSDTFLIPQDASPRPFLVNESISFEIDRSLLPFPEEVIDETTFIWEFGDGRTEQGLIQTHQYTKPGTYLLQITADYGKYATENVAPTALQSLFVDVIPSEDYSLPQAKFSVDEMSLNPETSYINADLSDEITLDARDSIPSPGGTLTTYTWYFDTGEIKEGERITYQYQDNPYLATPILRITDSNGFTTDTQITLKNTQFGKKSFTLSPLVGIGILGILGVCILILIFYVKKK